MHIKKAAIANSTAGKLKSLSVQKYQTWCSEPISFVGFQDTKKNPRIYKQKTHKEVFP